LGMERRGVAVLLLLAFVMLPGLQAQAQTFTLVLPDPYLNYSTVNDTLVIDSTYYRITINTTNGIIKSIVFKMDGDYVLYPKETPPITLAYAPSTTVEGNLNLTLVEFASVEIVDYGNGLATVVFSDPLTGGYEGTLRLIIDYTKPYLDFVFTAPPGTTALIVAGNASLADQWVVSLSVFEGQVLNTYATNETGAKLVAGNLEAAVMAGIVSENGTNSLNYIYGVSTIPGYKGPDLVGMFNKSSIFVTNYTVTDETLAFGAIFYPTNETLAALRVAVATYDPYIVLAANLVRPINAIYENVIQDLKPILYYTRYVQFVDNTIQTLKDQITKLQEENANLSKQLAELQGCESYWKAELEKVRYDLARVQNQLKQMGAVSIGAFFLGIILGVIGGVYVFDNLRQGRRKK